MLMVPILVPVPVAIVAGVEGEPAAPAGAAAPVWANAVIVNPKIVEKTATARIERRNLLVIGSLKLLGNMVPANAGSGQSGSGNELRSPFSGNAGPLLARSSSRASCNGRRQTSSDRRTGMPASHAG